MTFDDGPLESQVNGGDAETGRKIVAVISCVLSKLVERNDLLPTTHAAHTTVFHALKTPGISVEKYLERIVKYSPCSPESYILALIYVDRIIQFNPDFVVTSLNIHRLLLTAVMVGAKFLDDTYYNNAYYAKVGGIPLTELNALEVEFLFLVDFNLGVHWDAFERYRSELAIHINTGSCPCCWELSLGEGSDQTAVCGGDYTSSFKQKLAGGGAMPAKPAPLFAPFFAARVAV